MRLYSLVNADGETYNLTDEFVLFYSTSGLGFETDNTYLQIGSRFVPLTKNKRQASVKGKIIFYDEKPYIQYYEFARFAEVEPLILHYTTENGTFFRKVHVGSLSKGELTKAGVLDCDLEFLALTPWYKEIVVSANPNKKSGSRGNSAFPWVWPVQWKTDSVSTVNIHSDSNLESPCKIMIHGPITNPQWRHFVNGEYGGSGRVDYVVREDELLVVDTTTDPYSITIQNEAGDILADVYQLSAFETERFIHLRKGNNTINVSSPSLDEASVKVVADIYYDTV